MEKRNTLQKQLVLEAVRQIHDHPTADEVYRQVTAAHPSVSKATVYRNLNILAQDGLVRKVAVPGAADRFDFTPAPHYHVQCAVCGRIVDTPAPYMKELDAAAAKATGFEISRHELVFEGLCPECRRDAQKHKAGA